MVNRCAVALLKSLAGNIFRPSRGQYGWATYRRRTPTSPQYISSGVQDTEVLCCSVTTKHKDEQGNQHCPECCVAWQVLDRLPSARSHSYPKLWTWGSWTRV